MLLFFYSKVESDVMANEHKWSPVLHSRELVRVSKGFHSLVKSHTGALSFSQVLVKTLHEFHGGLVINRPE